MIDNGTHSCLSCFEIIKSNAKLSRVKDNLRAKGREREREKEREREMVNVYMQTDKQKNNIETKLNGG